MYADFFKFEMMKEFDKESFIVIYETFVSKIKLFVEQDPVFSKKKCNWEPLSDLAILLDINNLCSSKKGKKNPSPISVAKVINVIK